MKTWEIERMFKEDIREKKKTGSGAFHMRGKGVKHGFNGALRTPYHFMKTKEKNKLNGEVVVSNMFQTILNWTEFNQKDVETQKQLLTKWREIYPNTEIMKELSVGRKSKLNTQSYADIVNELGCPSKRRTGGIQPKKNKIKSVAIAAKNPNPEIYEITETLPVLEFETPQRHIFEVPKEEPKQPIVFNGFHLEYNGSYDSEQLNKIFTKLQLLVDGEENLFDISITITEKV